MKNPSNVQPKSKAYLLNNLAKSGFYHDENKTSADKKTSNYSNFNTAGTGESQEKRKQTKYTGIKHNQDNQDSNREFEPTINIINKRDSLMIDLDPKNIFGLPIDKKQDEDVTPNNKDLNDTPTRSCRSRASTKSKGWLLNHDENAIKNLFGNMFSQTNKNETTFTKLKGLLSKAEEYGDKQSITDLKWYIIL